MLSAFALNKLKTNSYTLVSANRLADMISSSSLRCFWFFFFVSLSLARIFPTVTTPQQNHTLRFAGLGLPMLSVHSADFLIPIRLGVLSTAN